MFYLQISHIIKSISKLQKRKDSLIGFCVLKRKSEGWGSFMVHSKKLEETMLWRGYQEKVSSDERRSSWVKEAYEASANYLKDVRLTFQNYTLHDETHILNVMDAMGGLLGDWLGRLTASELELLILAACLHDLGMVYTQEEKQKWFQDENACRKFLREFCPELLGRPAEEWSEEGREWYLRTLHPFRLAEVLEQEAWRELFDRQPIEMAPKRCVIAVCQAHGETVAELSNNRHLEYLNANEVDPLFCALLLRLGDLLDFDDMRAPKILFGYVACNEKSRVEWEKHQASAGFRFSTAPSASDLPYKARCKNPGIEHAIKDFLDWVDEELGNCIKLQKRCERSWQREFPFPRAVLRDEIESEGYMSGDFCLTMNQTQILTLLTGENLYDKPDVFIRELLQNAIDATLLRGEMEADFVPEKKRIDLWEWNDAEGNVWFRIDDQGTGMTLGMLRRYFLKVGNSYYHSQELERDLRDHGQTKAYYGISRFGIGFLSCFLCGTYAEVSTLYFDDEKNRREEGYVGASQTVRYGLRLQVTGLSGYYTLKNQAEHHRTDGPLPMPDGSGADAFGGQERDGYRASPGTSIVVRLDPGKLGVWSLRDAAERYLCGAKVPIYYNKKRIGRTHEEMMREAHEAEGERVFDLTPKMKREFDRSFPAVCGQYPKLAVSVVPLDAQENQALPELSGFLVKYDVRFEHELRWNVKDQTYKVDWEIESSKNTLILRLSSLNVSSVFLKFDWNLLKDRYGLEKIVALGEEFKKYSACPRVDDLLELWKSFPKHMDLQEVWKSYINNQQEREIEFSIEEFGCVDVGQRCLKYPNYTITYSYQGIIAGRLSHEVIGNDGHIEVFLLEGGWKPEVDISRNGISGLPFCVLLAIGGILCKYQMPGEFALSELNGWKHRALKEWIEIKEPQLDRWLKKNLKDFFSETKQKLQEVCKKPRFVEEMVSLSYHYKYGVIYKYLMAFFQNTYRMEVSYEEGQILSFYEKEDGKMEEAYELFPPMMFCMAASDGSRQFICSADPNIRRCITADHPFILWLLDHAAQLKQYYQRQFHQIASCLCDNSAEEIMRVCNKIREQLLAFPNRHGIDVSSFPQLSKDDFWTSY